MLIKILACLLFAPSIMAATPVVNILRLARSHKPARYS
jgi:hypothetical protein